MSTTTTVLKFGCVFEKFGSLNFCAYIQVQSAQKLFFSATANSGIGNL
jgi:hypothetical protein